jgi:hypothetical protein
METRICHVQMGDLRHRYASNMFYVLCFLVSILHYLLKKLNMTIWFQWGLAPLPKLLWFLVESWKGIW